MQDTLKKLQKILPKDLMKQFDDQLEKEMKATEKKCEEALKSKVKEID